MAITQNPITGRMHGTLGNAVASKWKGRNTLRSKALTVANPQTDGQMKQRAKFKILTTLGKMLSNVIRNGFKETAVSVTEFNRFMAINSANDYLTWDTDHWEADPSKLELSAGSLDSTSISSVSGTNGSSTMTVNFPTAVDGNKSANDKVYCVIDGNGNGGANIASVNRSTGTAVIAMDRAVATGLKYNVYLFFNSADGRKQSSTAYFDKTI